MMRNAATHQLYARAIFDRAMVRRADRGWHDWWVSALTCPHLRDLRQKRDDHRL